MARRAGKNPKVRAKQRAAAEQRQTLERRWISRRSDAPELSRLVTFSGNLEQARHRWLPYRQGLSKGLVDLFLAESGLVEGPLLDPFSGSGTVPLAAAQADHHGIGIDAVAALVYLARMKGAPRQNVPELPGPDGPDEFDSWAERLTHPLHHTALLAAAARTVSGSGKQRQTTDSPHQLMTQVLAMMSQDLETTCPGPLSMIVGDARRLPLPDNSVGGILTSPPYLARYDYARINETISRLHGHSPAALIRAHRDGPGGRQLPGHPAVEEAVQQLQDQAHRKQAGVVRGYFEDLARFIAELARVMAPGAPAWIVIGGAFLKKVYIPADLILAEQAQTVGLSVEEVLVARRLSTMGRSLGSMGPVDSREAILILRKP